MMNMYIRHTSRLEDKDSLKQQSSPLCIVNNTRKFTAFAKTQAVSPKLQGLEMKKINNRALTSLHTTIRTAQSNPVYVAPCICIH
jgi:hypothetical protein